MEYKCLILKCSEELFYWIGWGIQCIRLPLFSTQLQRAWYTVPENGYFLFFQSVNNGGLIIYHIPPEKITEAQLKKINKEWDYCIENNLIEHTFEL